MKVEVCQRSNRLGNEDNFTYFGFYKMCKMKVEVGEVEEPLWVVHGKEVTFIAICPK